jgi:hypothetical protein
METYVHKQDNSNYLNDNMLQKVGCVRQHDKYFKIQIDNLKPGIHDASFASKSPFKFLEFKFFDRVYHTRNLNQKT